MSIFNRNLDTWEEMSIDIKQLPCAYNNYVLYIKTKCIGMEVT